MIRQLIYIYIYHYVTINTSRYKPADTNQPIQTSRYKPADTYYSSLLFSGITLNNFHNDLITLMLMFWRTVGIAVILFLYLAKYNMPVPVWTPTLGFRIIRYPLHQVFAVSVHCKHVTLQKWKWISRKFETHVSSFYIGLSFLE